MSGWGGVLLATVAALLLLAAGSGDVPRSSLVHPAADEGVPRCGTDFCGWQPSQIPSAVATAQTNLNALAYTSPQTVAAVGNQATLLYSLDGGATWSLSTSPVSSMNYEAISPTPAGVLFATGTGGTLVRSMDGGQTWQIYPSSGLQGNVSTLHFLTDQLAYAAGDQGLFMTNDGATHWYSLRLPVAGAVRAAAFTSATEGWVNTFSDSQVYFTQDGGGNWTQGTMGVPLTRGSQIVARGGTSAWLLGDQGLLWRTSDGVAWSVTQLNTQLHTWQMFLDSGNDAWVVSDDANLFYTNTAGSCWIQESVPQIPELYAVAFSNATRGVVAGDGVIWSTQDAGRGANDSAEGCTGYNGPDYALEVIWTAVGVGVVGAIVVSRTWGKKATRPPPPQAPSDTLRKERQRRQFRGRAHYVNIK